MPNQCSNTGTFLDGNQAHAKYKTAEEFLEHALGYIEWCANNPKETHKTELVRGKPFHYKVKAERMPTMGGLQIYLGVSHMTMHNWIHGKKSPHLKEPLETMRGIIATKQAELAAANAVNAQFVGRFMGLVDHKETKVTSTTIDAPKLDALDVVDKIHPDAPIEDQLSDKPLLFSQRQIDAGIAYPSKTIDVTPQTSTPPIILSPPNQDT